MQSIFLFDPILQLRNNPLKNYFKIIFQYILYKMQPNYPTILNDDINNQIISLLDPVTDLTILACVDRYYYNLVNQYELYAAFKDFVCKVGKLQCQRELNFINACAHNYLIVAQYYYEICALEYINIYNHFYRAHEPALIKACENGHVNMAKWLFHKSIQCSTPININANTCHALIMACKNNHKETVEWLLLNIEKGYLRFCRKPLFVAFSNVCANGNIPIAELLLQKFNENTTNKRLSDGNYNHFLTLACKKGHLAMVKWLFQKSISMELPIGDNTNQTIFSCAYMNGHSILVQQLLQVSIEANIDIHTDDDRPSKT
jgi:hypothetical protein